MIEAALTAWQQTSGIEQISVAFGLIYVVLAAYENSWCWPAAMISTATAIYLFWDARLYMESGLYLFYFLMAIYGLILWRRGSQGEQSLAITSWRGQTHLKIIVLILALAMLSGFLLKTYTHAALPFVDSITTVASLFATFMVAKKVIENWLYWIVIDVITAWLYLQRGLELYALLMVIYTVIAVFGYMKWRSYIQAPKTACAH